MHKFVRSQFACEGRSAVDEAEAIRRADIDCAGRRFTGGLETEEHCRDRTEPSMAGTGG